VSGLPKGWVTAKLGIVAEFVMGQAPPGSASNFVGGGSPFVKAGEFGEARPIIREWTTKPLKFAKSSDVLICVVGATSGKINLGADCAIGRSVAAIRPKPSLDQKYLYNFLRTQIEILRNGSVGSAQGVISSVALSNIEIPLSPLPEQQRIVAKLDSLTGRTARAREVLGRIPRLIQKYREAILAAAFSGQLTRVNSIKNVPLSQYVATLDQGWSPKCESESSDEPTDWAVIKTTAIQPIHFLASENKKLPPKLQPRPQIQVREGDVLITRAGPRSRVGITCVVRSVRPRLMLCDKAYRIRVKNDRADPSFIAIMLNAPQSLSQIESMKSGISDSGLNLTQGKFLNLSLPKLTRSQQQEIVSRIETTFAWLDRVASEHANASRLLPKLDQAILAKAFRGELVLSDGQPRPLADVES
jgi:type I restriction enzyme, S subunit